MALAPAPRGSAAMSHGRDAWGPWRKKNPPPPPANVGPFSTMNVLCKTYRCGRERLKDTDYCR